MRIVSWNLLHAGGAEAEHVLALIDRHRPDLMLMQEATERIDVLPARLGGYYDRMVLPGRQHGLAAWSPTPFQRPSRSLPLQRGLIVRRICQIVELEGLAIANVHLSHGQVLNRWQLRQIARALPDHAAILGDCNLLGRPLLPFYRDVGPRATTHRSADLIPLRLDRCFIRGISCASAERLGRGQSDHNPIAVTLTTRSAL